MNNNQNTPNIPNGPRRKQLAPRDLLIVAIAILVLTRINWTQMNSFHVLILFLLFLMLMLRWANMRKEAIRKQAMDRYKGEYDFEPAKPVNQSVFRWADEPAVTPAEEVPSEDMTVDGSAVPAEETAEKTTE